MIVLEMKCPQLSKPEATAARNQNSIGDRTEKKPEPEWTSCLFQLQQSQIDIRSMYGQYFSWLYAI